MVRLKYILETVNLVGEESNMIFTGWQLFFTFNQH